MLGTSRKLSLSLRPMLERSRLYEPITTMGRCATWLTPGRPPGTSRLEGWVTASNHQHCPEHTGQPSQSHRACLVTHPCHSLAAHLVVG